MATALKVVIPIAASIAGYLYMIHAFWTHPFRKAEGLGEIIEAMVVVFVIGPATGLWLGKRHIRRIRKTSPRPLDTGDEVAIALLVATAVTSYLLVIRMFLFRPSSAWDEFGFVVIHAAALLVCVLTDCERASRERIRPETILGPV